MTRGFEMNSSIINIIECLQLLICLNVYVYFFNVFIVENCYFHLAFPHFVFLLVIASGFSFGEPLSPLGQTWRWMTISRDEQDTSFWLIRTRYGSRTSLRLVKKEQPGKKNSLGHLLEPSLSTRVSRWWDVSQELLAILIP